MILTITPNPSIDVTFALDHSLEVGGVNRSVSGNRAAGGKGINVSRVLRNAGLSTLALLPAATDDPMVSLLGTTGVEYRLTAASGPVRTNTTVTDPDGITTKINESAQHLSADDIAALLQEIEGHASQADAIVLAGSLPRGIDADFYALAVRAIRAQNPHAFVAVDTSDVPLHTLGAQLEHSAPDLLKPNGFELGQLTDTDGRDIEKEAHQGDFSKALAAGRSLLDRGAKELLITLGGAGALGVSRDACVHVTPPPTTVRSTVGAGDSSLAGYLIARSQGCSFEERIRYAAAYGSAAASLPGTSLPDPDTINLEGTNVRSLHSQ